MTTPDPVELVAKIGLFSALEAKERRAIASLLRVQRYPARASVVWEGDDGVELFFILSG